MKIDYIKDNGEVGKIWLNDSISSKFIIFLKLLYLFLFFHTTF